MELFGKNYYPTKNIAIDEGLVPWRGNIHFMESGLKSYQLCDDTDYCCVYGATYDVCMHLMNRSPMFSHLYIRGTGDCGTLRPNRK